MHDEKEQRKDEKPPQPQGQEVDAGGSSGDQQSGGVVFPLAQTPVCFIIAEATTPPFAHKLVSPFRTPDVCERKRTIIQSGQQQRGY